MTQKRMEVTGRYHRVSRLTLQQAQIILEPVGIFPGQPPILFALERENGITQKAISECVHIRAATVTVMLQRMEKSGLIIREIDSRDQRKVRVFLTDKGFAKAKEARRLLSQFEADVYADCTFEELEQMDRVLMKMEQRLLMLTQKGEKKK